MTEFVFDTAFDITIGFEGNYQCLENDRGNWTGGKVGEGELRGTKYGISAMAYPDVDIKNLTIEQAREIYKRDYWDRCKCAFMPDALSIALFDFAVNSGTKRAIRYLQMALSVTIDGVIGNQTIGACNRIPTKDVLEKFIRYRLEFLMGLKNWKYFGGGWGYRVKLLKDICEKYL